MAEQPNDMLASPTSPTTTSPGGADVEILSWLDDHERYVLSIAAHTRVSGPIVVETFHAVIALHGNRRC